MIFVYSVFSSKKEAVKITEALIKAKLAACVNLWSIDSIYRWQGKIEKAKECAAMIKTSKKNFKAMERFILQNHSYKVPCIIEIPSGRVNRSFEDYICQSC